MPSINR